MNAVSKVLWVFIACLGTLVLALPAAGQDEAEDHPLLLDAEFYAAEHDVMLDEALRRLELQPTIGRLRAELAETYPARFAGLWVQHEPTWLIVVQLTGRGVPGLEELLRSDAYYELYPHVEVRAVPRSLRALEAVQEAARKAAAARGIEIDSSIDVRENLVSLHTTRFAELVDALGAADQARSQAGQRPLLDDVKIEEVEALAQPARYLNGGHPLSGCTSGFAVQDAYGALGIATAGHCYVLGGEQYFNRRHLPVQSYRYSGSYDVEWHKPSGELHVTNRIWDGLYDTATPYYRFITTTKPRSQQYIGEYVCKYGVTTGATCGTISSTTVAPSYVPSASATFIRVTSSTTDQSQPGDSGGPWYYGSTAYGIMSGHFTTNLDAIYMAIDYVAGVGVSVLTSTPSLPLARFTYKDMGNAVNAYTEINANQYECGLAGIAAIDGDIDEGDAGDIITGYLNTASGHFNYVTNFRSHGDHESWDFDLLCLQKSQYSLLRYRYSSLGNNPTFNTGLSTTTYECGIGGMAALNGDIEEHDAGDIIQTWMYRSAGQWWLRADFRTHNNHESWNLDALCINRSHPVTRYEFKNLGDNVNGYNTYINSNTHVCGVAGMAARNGDINENDDGNIIQAYIYPSGGTWRIRADFRTHNNSESWDIDLLCIQR